MTDDEVDLYVRARSAEAERDRYRKALEFIDKCFVGTGTLGMSSHGAISLRDHITKTLASSEKPS